MDLIEQIWTNSGIYQISGGQLAMLGICLVLLYLGIVKKFEPLLLVTIGFGGLLSNIPGAGIAEPGGLLFLAYEVGIKSGAFPLIIRIFSRKERAARMSLNARSGLVQEARRFCSSYSGVWPDSLWREGLTRPALKIPRSSCTFAAK